MSNANRFALHPFRKALEIAELEAEIEAEYLG
jgi:hypothetical protein